MKKISMAIQCASLLMFDMVFSMFSANPVSAETLKIMTWEFPMANNWKK
ncbi:hypothetical protein QUF76_11415 [Desulfobacterales bacterium HSG16]|nr:hypothetical protein [Desulfobacterales bacterium HSG16]